MTASSYSCPELPDHPINGITIKRLPARSTPVVAAIRACNRILMVNASGAVWASSVVDGRCVASHNQIELVQALGKLGVFTKSDVETFVSWAESYRKKQARKARAVELLKKVEGLGIKLTAVQIKRLDKIIEEGEL